MLIVEIFLHYKEMYTGGVNTVKKMTALDPELSAHH